MHLGSGDQSRGVALQTGAAGATDAVDEVFRHLGQVVVDDVGYIVHVQAARSDVGRDQHLVTAFLKSAQSAVPLRLRAVAVNHRRSETVADQFLGQPFGAAFGAREDQRLAFFCIEQLAQHIELLARTNFVSLQLHAFRGLEHRTQGDAHRIAHVVIHQAGNGLLQGG